MTPKRTGLAAGMLVAALIPGWAAAQPLSNEGWSYNSGSNFHAQSQILRKQQKAAASAGSGGGGGGGAAVIVNNATTIGNQTNIEQILAEGANAYLNTNTVQNTSGTQASTATGGGHTTTTGTNGAGSGAQ